MNLSEQQKRAVRFFKGPALVAAGPGSGKTAVLTRRVLYLAEERNVDPTHILVLTFTRAAAGEMEERYRNMAPPSLQGAVFGTFHSFFFRILRESCGFSARDLLTEEARHKLIRRICRRVMPKLANDPDFIRDVSSEISRVRRIHASISAYESDIMPPDAFRRLFGLYTEYLKENRKIDFDDCILESIRVFREHPDILLYWQEQFSFILVDEFQDVSQTQFELVRLLAGTTANLFAVGDDDQAIYGFRGAGTDVLQKFREYYPDSAYFPLNMNYRCGSEIVRASRLVIEENKKRIEKDLKAAGEEPGRVRIIHTPDEYREADCIAREIKILCRTGARFSDFAVLCRTKPIESVFHKAFERMNIPDTMSGMNDSEAKEDILAYLRAAEDPGNARELYKILERPERDLEREAFGRGTDIFRHAEEFYRGEEKQLKKLRKLMSDLKILHSLPPFAAVNFIRKGIGYEDWLRTVELSRGNDGAQTEKELDQIQAEAAEFSTFYQWERALKDKAARKKADQKGPAVTLTTIHASKGLEYKHVYLPAVNEGILPYSRALTPDAVEEERRLFYVAMTRAKSSLTILTEKERLHRPQTASRFLSPLSDFPVYELSFSSSDSSASSSISMASSSSSKASETSSYSSSESMYPSDGLPFSSSSYR
ncbi:MAG: ATP-dependent helicase [Lachnospiraceae bacterium]|jgi:DNA helicase-2/ATP-dependent DNA helicase PcrA